MPDRPPPEAPGLDQPCPYCNKPVGDHTIRGYGECCHASGLDYVLPYEDIVGGPVRMTKDDDQMMCGAVDVAAGVTDTALGRLPLLGFRFYMVGAEPMSSVPSPLYLLLGDDRLMADTVELVRVNAAKARAAARQ